MGEGIPAAECDYSPNMTPDATICAVRWVSFSRFTSVGLT
jgi:hypothetical protein